jgi:quinol monooxygenase YgiN
MHPPTQEHRVARHDSQCLLSVVVAGALLALSGCHSPAIAEQSMSFSKPESAARCCAVVELRQYTLHPNQRDTLIALFDREFVETQEAVGIRVVGQFRDLDDPDRFVWLRGFADMPARAAALTAFYSGPVWQQHRNAANATMIDSDNVLLLKPVSASSGFVVSTASRPPQEATTKPTAIVVATIYYFDRRIEPGFADFFRESITPLVSAGGAEVLASFVTEAAVNTFPKLPVREGEHVFVWFARHADAAAFAQHTEALAATPAWQQVEARLQQSTVRTQTLRLMPTPRSSLPGR